MKKKVKEAFIGKLKEVLLKSHVNKGSLLKISEESKNDLYHAYGIISQFNNQFKEYIQDMSSFEGFLIDYFLQRGTYSEEAEDVTFSNSEFNTTLDNDLEKLIDLINSIPLEYRFTLPLQIYNDKIKGLDIKLSERFSLQGLLFKDTLFSQYTRTLSGYYTTVTEELTQGNNLTIVGKHKGFIFKYYPNYLANELIIEEIEEIISLMSFSGVLKVPEKALSTINTLNLHYYIGENQIASSELPKQLSNWVCQFIISEEAFVQQRGLFPELFKEKTEPIAELEAFKQKLGDIKDFLEMKTLPIKEETAFKRYNTSLKWYLESLTSENYTMKLVDLCIVLEILLGSENHDARKKIEIPERVSLIIGSNIEDRKKSLDIVEKAINKRNEIVHQGKALNNKDKQLVYDLHTIVFRIMQKELSFLKSSIKKT